MNFQQLRRMEKLELTIHDLCEKGRRNPKDVLNILQAINDGRQVKMVLLSVFPSAVEQFQGFIAYNEWLEENHPEYAISQREMAKMHEKLAELDPEALVFYCHQGDVVLTTKLAWDYICSYREKTLKSAYIRFEDGYMKADEREPARPKGFYTMRRPPEDKEAIGKRFQGIPVRKVRQKLGNDWGMGSEVLQFVGITHKHYLELMNGNEIPFIDLPGLAVSPNADGDFFVASCLRFSEGGLELRHAHVGGSDSDFGSGSLRQC